MPRLPYWAEGAGEDQAGLARCSKPRPDNPPKCCPAAKRLYFRPLSAKAGLVSSSSWFNPSGWGRTLWQEEGTWKPLVTGLPCQCCLPPTGPGQARPASRDATQSAPLRPSSPARVPGSEAPTPPFPGRTLVRTRKGLGTPGRRGPTGAGLPGPRAGGPWTPPTRHGAGTAVRPAGAAVLGDVLVPGDAGVVDAVHIAPVPALGQVRRRQVLMGPGVGPARDHQPQPSRALPGPAHTGPLGPPPSPHEGAWE